MSSISAGLGSSVLMGAVIPRLLVCTLLAVGCHDVMMAAYFLLELLPNNQKAPCLLKSLNSLPAKNTSFSTTFPYLVTDPLLLSLFVLPCLEFTQLCVLKLLSFHVSLLNTTSRFHPQNFSSQDPPKQNIAGGYVTIRAAEA